jgi:MFS family permease
MPVGMLGDIFRKKYMIALTLGMVGLSLLLFWLFNSRTPFWLTVLFAVFYGVGIAGIMPLRMPILAEYFGRKNMGKLFGIISIPSIIGGVAAVPLAGVVFDAVHSYKPVLLALAGFSLAAVILMLLMPSAQPSVKN